MERRSERIKNGTKSNQAPPDVSSRLQNSVSRKNELEIKSALPGEKKGQNKDSTEKPKQDAIKRRKAIMLDNKEDGKTPISIRGFRGMRGKLRQLAEFPLDILFEACTSNISMNFSYYI
jgi:hypothetical protein